MFDKWYESAKTLLNLYKKLAELRIDGKENTDEYNLILSLLESAIKFENDKIEAIDFSDENIGKLYDIILEYISVDNPLNVDDLFTENDALVYARMHNIAESIDYFNRDSRVDELDQSNFIEYLASLYVEQDEKDVKFGHLFQSYVGFNIIYIINYAIDNTKDKQKRDFLIKLLYSSMYINPRFEEYFKKNMVVSKPINVSIYMTDLVNDRYSKDQMMDDIIYNLVDFSIDELEAEINKSDAIFLDPKEYFIYINSMTGIMGKLISLMDTRVVDQVDTRINQIIKSKGRTDNLRIVNEVCYMFDEARRIIKKYSKGRDLKYGKIPKETD